MERFISNIAVGIILIILGNIIGRMTGRIVSKLIATAGFVQLGFFTGKGFDNK